MSSAATHQTLISFLSGGSTGRIFAVVCFAKYSRKHAVSLFLLLPHLPHSCCSALSQIISVWTSRYCLFGDFLSTVSKAQMVFNTYTIFKSFKIVVLCGEVEGMVIFSYYRLFQASCTISTCWNAIGMQQMWCSKKPIHFHPAAEDKIKIGTN